jgi:hypothetical protein
VVSSYIGACNETLKKYGYISANFWLWRVCSVNDLCNCSTSSPALQWSSICLIFGSTCCNNDSLTDSMHLWKSCSSTLNVWKHTAVIVVSWYVRNA